MEKRFLTGEIIDSSSPDGANKKKKKPTPPMVMEFTGIQRVTETGTFREILLNGKLKVKAKPQDGRPLTQFGFIFPGGGLRVAAEWEPKNCES